VGLEIPGLIVRGLVTCVKDNATGSTATHPSVRRAEISSKCFIFKSLSFSDRFIFFYTPNSTI
jgi:hypothetical protein